MTVHLVAQRVLPCPGGLQESMLRIGGSLARAGHQVIAYALDQPAEFRISIPKHDPLTVIYLDGRDRLLEPFRADAASESLKMERSRATALLLRNAVARQMENTRSQHVMVSFYASGAGFLAQMAATALKIPHIASVRGTDFELDVFGARQHIRLRAAIETANLVVTTNRGQAESLTALFRPRRPIRTIHNAVHQDGRPSWQAPSTEPVRLISDCGFSGRKATHLLLSAAAGLIDRGLPVSIAVFGGTFFLDPPTYWEDLRRTYQSRYPGRFDFPGHVDHNQLELHMRGSHIYCSATLAEGSSISRIRALTLGIPIVTTRTGDLGELAAGCSHVRLCPAGDEAALALQLEAAVSDTLAGTVQPDPDCIQRWRRHFSIDRERDEWLAAIQSACEESA